MDPCLFDYTTILRRRLKIAIYNEEVAFLIIEFADALILKVFASISVKNTICS